MTEPKKPANGEMLQGTLDMLILRTLVMGKAHGHTIAHVIENTSDDVLQVEQGSLYPALHRLENKGFLAAEWKESETGREAKFYRLTAKGRQSPGLPRTGPHASPRKHRRCT